MFLPKPKPKPTKNNNIFGYFSVLRKAYFIWIRIILSVIYQILAIFTLFSNCNNMLQIWIHLKLALKLSV